MDQVSTSITRLKNLKLDIPRSFTFRRRRGLLAGVDDGPSAQSPDRSRLPPGQPLCGVTDVLECAIEIRFEFVQQNQLLCVL
jgi:hypothetical protein